MAFPITPFMFFLLYNVHYAVFAQPLSCPNCGNLTVPYPLSTSSSCGDKRYSLTCVEANLYINAPTGEYRVKKIDAKMQTLVIETPALLKNRCITEDSIQYNKFQLYDNGPFSISDGNTIMLYNCSQDLLYTPMICGRNSPCFKALYYLPELESCQNRSSAVQCCSHGTTARVFKYTVWLHGLYYAFVSAYDLDNTTDASTWNYGLRLSWSDVTEPPCFNQSQCLGNSICGKKNSSDNATVCVCNSGFQWDSSIGICTKIPFCEMHKHSVSCHKVEYACGITIGLLAFIMLSTVAFHNIKRHHEKKRAHAKVVKERALILSSNSGRSARLFSNKEMTRATNNYSKERVLGVGAFGEVYKGILDDGTIVAIKSAKVGTVKGVDQVLNEVRILSQVNHKSLVRLLGCCVESELPLLVYEYIPNGNLFEHLNGEHTGILDWMRRLHIGLQAAEGLSYLHFSADPPIYHRDVKSSNILLDKCMNARVADFGLSRLAEPDLTHISTCAQGTLGYLDPEYYRHYQLTEKSDVYSFGVVLLELVTSQKAIDFFRSQENINLATMVQQKEELGSIDDVLDPNLVEGASQQVLLSMRSVVHLALHCLHDNRNQRPTMKEVAESLQQIINHLENPHYS